MNFTFDLQRFSDGPSTTVQSYQPSEYELQLQKATADYADAVSPNAKWLNDVARGVLQNSLGTMQVDYDSLYDQARDMNNRFMGDMYDSINGNNEALNVVQNQLAGLYGQLPGIVNEYLGRTNGIIDSNSRAADATNDVLGNISSAYGRNASQGNEKLDRLAGQGNDALADANGQLDRLIGKSEGALDKYADVRDQLIRGELPSPYLQNMRDAVAGTMKQTAGQGLNALANRGILNSSVTEGVLNDIEKNATDTVTGRFLDNINTINNLLGSQTGDSLNLLGQQANLIGQRFGNTGQTIDRNINIANTQTGNNANALGQQSTLAQQQLGNINTANNTNAGLLNQQYQNRMNTVGTQAGMTNQYLQNQLGVQAQNANTLNGLLGHTADNITTAAAAQEAAQQPAQNLWNMSLGLQGSNTGALAAAAGQGTTTTTGSKGGGGLFSGLLGGLF